MKPPLCQVRSCFKAARHRHSFNTDDSSVFNLLVRPGIRLSQSPFACVPAPAMILPSSLLARAGDGTQQMPSAERQPLRSLRTATGPLLPCDPVPVTGCPQPSAGSGSPWCHLGSETV